MKNFLLFVPLALTLLFAQKVNDDELMDIQVPFWGLSSIKSIQDYSREEIDDLRKSGKWVVGNEINYVPFKVPKEEPIDAVIKVLLGGEGQINYQGKKLRNPLGKTSSKYYKVYEKDYYKKSVKEFVDAEIKNDTAYVYFTGTIWEAHLGLTDLENGILFAAAQFVDNDIDRVKIYFDGCTVDWGYGVINSDDCIEGD